MIGRISTLILMILAAIMALFLTNAMQAFNILLQIGAGTGLLFLLRWFWWRINAYSEIVAMIVSLVLAIYFEMIYNVSPENGGLEGFEKMIIAVAITTICWIAATLLTRPTSRDTLVQFYNLIRPHKMGWKPILSDSNIISTDAPSTSLSREILMMFLGCVAIYSVLFSTGYLLYMNMMAFLIAAVVALISGYALIQNWKK